MPWDAADIAAFNDADMPAYAAATFGALTLEGRFREAYVAELGIGGSLPVYELATADLGSIAAGSSLTINGAGYTVTSVEPNANSGQTTLRLQESS